MQRAFTQNGFGYVMPFWTLQARFRPDQQDTLFIAACAIDLPFEGSWGPPVAVQLLAPSNPLQSHLSSGCDRKYSTVIQD